MPKKKLLRRAALRARKPSTTRRAAPKKRAAATKPASFPIPALRAGEGYAGVLLDAAGKPIAHLVELAAERENLTHAEALAFAKEQGGELPDRQEAALLYANRKAAHQERWYWTREEYAGDSAYAWIQYFGDGHQGGGLMGNRYLARAVRRVPI
jgi:hypothetical protein